MRYGCREKHCRSEAVRRWMRGGAVYLCTAHWAEYRRLLEQQGKDWGRDKREVGEGRWDRRLASGALPPSPRT